jgi:hypothetical protein
MTTKEVEDLLDGLEIAIRESVKMAKQDYEFTVHDYITKAQSEGQILSYNAAEKRLIRMAEKKLLKFRLLPVNGYHTRVYSAY